METVYRGTRYPPVLRRSSTIALRWWS